ncbi:response regulator [candidate division WOR-3 bacterium]|nr:response regulator [candidate division WOR-3 bacterium]
MEILLADDDNKILKSLTNILTLQGHNCKTSSDGFEAVNEYKKNNFDCVLLDIEMPGMNGIEAAKALLSVNPDVSIIMVTAFRDIDIIRSTMRVGAYDYLVKPVLPEELGRVLEKVKERNFLLRIKRDYQIELEAKVREQREKIEKKMLDTITSLVNALEAKDPYQEGHSKQVKEIALEIADKLAYTKKEKEMLSYACMIHDIGKVGIPDSILMKPETLTEKEYAIMKKHPEIGEFIINPAIRNKKILNAVLHHHERYDGKGFPDGLEGKKIPESARILAIADSLSAMMSKRPYRKGLSHKEIVEELRKNSGTQFDPKLVKICLKLMEKGEINYNT